MANWTKLTNGTWGVQTRGGRAGDRIVVTTANGQTANVTLGALVKTTRWGRVFVVAGRDYDRSSRRRRRRRNPGEPSSAGTLATLRAEVAATLARRVVSAPVVVDPSVARFLLLDLSDAPAARPESVDNGPVRRLQID